MSRTLDQAASSYASNPLLEPFGVPDHIVAAPVNTASTKFIKLTAGLDGVGQYNEGLLTGESITNAAPLIVATAVIVLGPHAGATINLLNSESRYVKPGVSSGTAANDKMQQITGELSASGSTFAVGLLSDTNAGTVAGAFSPDGISGRYVNNTIASGRNVKFDSADSPNARTGTATDTKHVQLTYYARIM
jgi:hypothetical protein